MPDGTSNVTPGALSASDVRDLYQDLIATYSQRNMEYQKNRDRYRGIHWGSEELPEDPGKTMLTVNYVRPVVDMGVDMLIGRLPGIQVVPRGTDAESRRLAEAMEAVLYTAWNSNGAAMTFRQVFQNRALLRRGIIYYWWDFANKSFKFRSIAPDNFLPVYDGNELVEVVVVSRRLTRELKRSYPKLAEDIRPDQEGDLVFDEARWTRVVAGQIDPLDENSGKKMTTHGELAGQTTVIDWYDKNGNWRRVMGDATHSQRLTYTKGVPFIEFPNGVNGDESDPRSEIDDIWELNLYANQLISANAEVLKKFANPTIIDYGSGQSPQDVKRTVEGEGLVLPARKDSRLEYLMWTGTAPDFSQQWERVMGAIYDISGKPASAFGQTVTNQSGVMTNLALTPTTRSAEAAEAMVSIGLEALNSACLRAYEKMLPNQEIHAQGVRPSKHMTHSVPYDFTITGREIDGWYENRIKWPSALRTDDPVYVQNILAQVQSKPQVLNIYDAMEMLGYENVEQMLNRLREEQEDPRIHPELMREAVNAASTFGAMPDMGGMEGFDPGMETEADSGMVEAAGAAGNPNRDQLAEGY